MINRYSFIFMLMLNSCLCKAQFATTAANWPTPQGGLITNNNLLGYNAEAGVATGGQTNSSQSWALVDINGDGKPDLVVTAAVGANGPTQFNASTSPYWQVYINTGNGFSASAVNWPTPQGGLITGNNLLGYNYVAGVAANGQTNSSQSWALTDINGDGKPDLVVTAALGANGAIQFNASTTPNWQVYLNTGSGFSLTATNWPTPQGGMITSNNLLGYNYTAGVSNSGQTNSSQSWDLVDINGDGKPDLVVAAASDANGPTQFNASTTPNWQVYLNTGSGFSSNAVTWPTPQGGIITSNNLLGFNYTSGVALNSQTTSSQSWALTDINGDGKPDLVVTAALGANGATQFNAATTPGWQVYFNTGNGFSSTVTNWPTPQGGLISNNNLLGYNYTSGSVVLGQNNGSQNWDLVDINGDGKPDLVVTSSRGANGALQFNATSSPYWQVFNNTGSGFSSTATNWTTTQGGLISSNTLLGYNATAGVATASQTTTSQTWSLTDMNGDGVPDLVVEADEEANGAMEFSAATNPYWNVFFNNGATAIRDDGAAPFASQLFPNPNSGTFNLVFNDAESREVEVTNIMGQPVLSVKQVLAHAQIALPDVAPGIYFVAIRQNGLVSILKVSIAR